MPQRAESLSMYASSPTSSFSLRAWHDLVLANSLNINFVSLSLIRESIPGLERQLGS